MWRRQLTKDEARAKLCEATQQVDFINLARVISSLGEYAYDWNKYDGSKLKPNFEQAWRDRKWFANNASLIIEALEVLKESGKE